MSHAPSAFQSQRYRRLAGESSASVEADASKVALCALVDRLRARGYALLDIQWVTPHLAQFGAIQVRRKRYLKLLDESLKLNCSFTERAA